MPNRQLKGSFKIALAGNALVDVSASISSMKRNGQKATVTVPAVLSTAQSSVAAGDKTESITIRFHSGIEATSLWARLSSIFASADSAADWEAIFDPLPVTADNPRYSGTHAGGNGLILLNLDQGEDVGALRQQTLTMPLEGPPTVAIT